MFSISSSFIAFFWMVSGQFSHCPNEKDIYWTYRYQSNSIFYVYRAYFSVESIRNIIRWHQKILSLVTFKIFPLFISQVKTPLFIEQENKMKMLEFFKGMKLTKKYFRPCCNLFWLVTQFTQIQRPLKLRSSMLQNIYWNMQNQVFNLN